MPLKKLELPDPLAPQESILTAGLLANNAGKNEGLGINPIVLGSLLQPLGSQGSQTSQGNQGNQTTQLNGGLIDLAKSGLAAIGLNKIFSGGGGGIGELGGDTLLTVPKLEGLNLAGTLPTSDQFLSIPGINAVSAEPTSLLSKAKGFAGSTPGTALLAAAPSLLKGDVAGGAGAASGAALASVLFPESAILAPLVGGFLGKGIIGKGLKKLGLGKKPSVGPNAGGSGIVSDDGRLTVGEVGSDNGGNSGFVTQFLTSVSNQVNDTLGMEGKKLELPANSRPLYVEVIKGKLNIYDAPGSFRSFDANQISQAHNYAVNLITKGKEGANTKSSEVNKTISELDAMLAKLFAGKGKTDG